ncbi:MAG: hypothetical protein WD740_08280 [Anaerolineales bacterium]
MDRNNERNQQPNPQAGHGGPRDWDDNQDEANPEELPVTPQTQQGVPPRI